MEKARFNFTLPTDVKGWLEDESKTTGIPQSTLVLIALKTYIDQQKMMKMTSQLNLLEGCMEKLDMLNSVNKLD